MFTRQKLDELAAEWGYPRGAASRVHTVLTYSGEAYLREVAQRGGPNIGKKTVAFAQKLLTHFEADGTPLLARPIQKTVWLDTSDKEHDTKEAAEAASRRKTVKAVQQKKNEDLQAKIYDLRWGPKPLMTLAAIGEMYGISGSRVRTLEIREFEKRHGHLLEDRGRIFCDQCAAVDRGWQYSRFHFEHIRAYRCSSV